MTILTHLEFTIQWNLSVVCHTGLYQWINDRPQPKYGLGRDREAYFNVV